jgi:hypothetical protein
MIYFTEITQASGKGTENIIFQFLPRELPEVIPFAYKTKLNHIEYNGGFHTNQIIGIYPEPVEWEGLFYGTYQFKEGQKQSAKERAFQLKQLMGRPLRCVFAIPTANTKESNAAGKPDDKFTGEAMVCVIEELSLEVSDYADVRYRIKLMPHQRQERIKPKDINIASIAVEPDMVKAASAGRAARRAAGAKQAAAAKAGQNTQDTAKRASDGPPSLVEFLEEARTANPTFDTTPPAPRGSVPAGRPGN